MSNVNLIFFGMPQSLPLVNELGKHYTSKGGFDVRFMSSVVSLSTMLETSVNGIFIFKVENKKDLTDAVTILKTHRKLVKKGLLKPACVSKVKNKKVDKILSKYGCLDILEPNITPKTLSFKIDFWSRSIGTILKKAQLNNENLQVKSSATEVKEQELKVDIVLVDPLDLQSDIWLLKAKTDYKKILRRWLVRLLGPSPHAGSWVELEPQPGDQEPSWKYVLRNDDGQFVLEDGAWFFYGSKPDFDWKIQRWIFSSSTPHLYFYSRSGQVYSRIKYEKGQLLIAKNSEYAQMKENLILATCESKFEFLNEDQQTSPDHREFDEDSEDLGGSLSGAAATEKLDSGPMAGSIRSDIDASKSPEKQTSLATEFEDIDGNLTGKSHTDNINNDPLRGKSSTDALDHSPLEGRVNNPLGAKEKAERESQGFSEDPIDGHLRGKSSTDALDHSPLEGKVNNPLGAKEKAERESQGFSEDPIDGHFRGKSSTDALDHSPLEGKVNNPLGAKEKAERESQGFSEDPIDGHLRGKSSTDALDHSPLEGRVNNPLSAKEKAERESEGFSEDPIDGHLRGKSSTDALDHSPLEGKVNNPLSAKEKAERESEGFSEDPIDGHLRGTSSTDALDHSPLESSMKNPLDAKTRNTEDDGSDEDFENWADDISESPISSNYSSPLEGKNIQNPLAAPRASQAEDPNSANGNQNILKGSFKGGTIRDAVQGDIKQSLHSKDRERPAAPKQTIGTVANPFGGKRKRPDADVDFSEDLARLGEELPVINDGISKEIGESGESEASKDPSANVDMLGSAPKIDPTKKESEMDELLGGGLTEGAYSDTLREEVSNEIEDLDDQRDFQAIIGDGVDVNTESGEVKVVVKQETKNGNHITFLCQFDDLYEDELMVKAPKDSINTKSEVSVSLSMKYNQKKVQIASTGKIVDVEKDTDEPWDLLVIELKNIDKKKIEQFMSLYEERQESIHDFMNKAKGL